MKNIIYFFIAVCITLLSCTNKQNRIPHEIEYKIFMDSIFKADSILKDSLKKIIGNNALGQIKFGMNKKQFEEAKKIFMDSIKGPLNDYYLGDTEFYDIDPMFNNKGELYQITISSLQQYQLMFLEDICTIRDFVDYLTDEYGLSKDNKHETWIVGSTSFTRTPDIIVDGTKPIRNPNWHQGCKTEKQFLHQGVVICDMNLVIKNKKYITNIK